MHPNRYQKWAGIDLGGRTTAKTAVAWMSADCNRVQIVSAAHLAQVCGASDRLFLDWLAGHDFDLIGFDAPLSLPDCTTADYLYRPGDRLAGAMSPFTIGELSARAMYLASQVKAPSVEVYPKLALQMLGLPHRRYKQDTDCLPQRAEAIASRYGWQLNILPADSDSFDALLALVSVWHFIQGRYRNLSDNSIPFVQPIDPPADRH